MELTKLKVLNVSNCKTITGECLINLNNLKRLIIYNTNIHERYLQNLKNLKCLCIDNCNNIIIGRFLLQMNQLKCLSCIAWFNTSQINEIKLNINKGMILVNSVSEVLTCNNNENQINKQDKAIYELQ